MMLFFFAWVLIGMSFAFIELKWMDSSTPNMVDLMANKLMEHLQEEHPSLSHETARKWFITSLTLLWVLLWPFMIVRRMF